MVWTTFAWSAKRRFSFAALAIVGAFAIAGCAQNAQGISPVAAKSDGTVASVRSVVPGGSGTATARGRSATGDGGDRGTSTSARDVSTGCPTQGEGGDALPALCAPPPSPDSRPHVTGPATVTAPASPTPTPSPTACPGLDVESASPAQGAESGGDAVTINGTGFNASTEVFFGGMPVQTQTVVSATEISVTTPPGPSGGGTVAITVDCSGVRSPVAPGVTFTYAAGAAASVGTPSSSSASVSSSARAS
jgi:hypothetical protein